MATTALVLCCIEHKLKLVPVQMWQSDICLTIHTHIKLASSTVERNAVQKSCVAHIALKAIALIRIDRRGRYKQMCVAFRELALKPI